MSFNFRSLKKNWNKQTKKKKIPRANVTFRWVAYQPKKDVDIFDNLHAVMNQVQELWQVYFAEGK